MQISDFLKSITHNVKSWAESDCLEWKESTSDLKSIVNTVAAFANTNGGLVVCGVNDNGEVTGMMVEDSTLRAITQAILANTDERLTAKIEKLTLENKTVLIVDVNESPLKPHLAYGKAYKRMGTSNVALSQAEYRQLLAHKQNGHGADRDLLDQLSIEDLDIASIYKFIDLANFKRNSNFSTLADPLDVLTNLELAHNGILTKAALLLFGKNPQKHLPSAEMRVAVFQDHSMSVFLDQDVITGTIFNQFDRTIEFIKKHIFLGSNTNIIGSRSSTQFPFVAMQEILVNALIHRDYHDQSSS